MIKSDLDNRNDNSMMVKKDYIVGSRRFISYWWATVICLGGFGFFIAGLSSYMHRQLVFFLDSTDIVFIPQGIIMVFYGTAAISLSIYLWLTIIWDIGSGYNEFNKTEKCANSFNAKTYENDPDIVNIIANFF